MVSTHVRSVVPLTLSSVPWLSYRGSFISSHANTTGSSLYFTPV
jgi:hypothetical protein